MRVIKDSDFGDVTLEYKMLDLDGTNLEEVVQVTSDTGEFLGNIFSVPIEDVTERDINDNCSYAA